MPVKFILPTSLLMIFGILTSCEAEDSHEKWYKCQTDDECVIVKALCGIEWAANKNFVEETRKIREYTQDCLKPAEFHPANTVAQCEKHQCVLVPRGTGGAPIP